MSEFLILVLISRCITSVSVASQENASDKLELFHQKNVTKNTSLGGHLSDLQKEEAIDSPWMFSQLYNDNPDNLDDTFYGDMESNLSSVSYLKEGDFDYNDNSFDESLFFKAFDMGPTDEKCTSNQTQDALYQQKHYYDNYLTDAPGNKSSNVTIGFLSSFIYNKVRLSTTSKPQVLKNEQKDQ